LKAYLLDTNILSVLAPDRAIVPPHIAEFIAREGLAGSLYVPAIAIAEIKRGILKLARRGGTAKAVQLQAWLDSLISEFSDRILPVDVPVSLAAAEIDDAAKAKGLDPGLADILIAATARVHDLAIVTNNLKHFSVLDVEIADLSA
jgi:predicted nucleic acid-binding protein